MARKEMKLEEKEEEKEAMKKEVIRPAGSLHIIFRYADMKDVLLMALGTIGCIADGSTTALTMLVFSKIMNSYSDESSFTLHEINEVSLWLIFVAVGVGLGAFLEGLCWARTAERQTSRIRMKYLSAVLRQDAAFLDATQGTSTTYEVITSISTDTLNIQAFLGEKVPNFLMNIATFIGSQLVALYLCWRLAVVTIPALSLLIVPGIVYGKLLMELGKQIQDAYGIAGGIAEQAFTSIRTVFSYVAENRIVAAFSMASERSLKLGIKQGLMKGLAIGSSGVNFAVWAFQAWYGSILVTEKGARGGDIFVAGGSIVAGGLALGSSLVNVKYFAEATTAAASIFEMIDRAPSTDSDNTHDKTMTEVRGEIKFKDVDFAYPSRPGSMILKKLNLQVMPSQTVGLVGCSGSGKSTVISLIERFYDPLGGEILLDGTNIKSLQLKWFRSQIGMVTQEPVLFATSIKENILFGKEDASMEDVAKASKAANAHGFITQLPDGYDTQVGHSGIQMSGGQKQRIAIARAILKDPRILLLDEATSALDSVSEKAVQETLNQASVGRTTIIVAHRLSTIKNANLIAVIQSGQVVECGSHDQLMQNKSGHYSVMVQLQQTVIRDSTYKTTNGINSVSYDLEVAGTFMNKRANSDNSVSFEKEGGNTVKVLNKSSPLQSPDHDNISIQPENYSGMPSLWSLLQITTPQWTRPLLGCIAALCFGAIQPINSFCMGALLSVYYLDDNHEIRLQTKNYCFAFLAFAIFTLITNLVQHYSFGVMGEHLTKRVRETMLAKILTFEIEWFDQENNNSGAICSRLDTEASLVRTVVCDRLSLLVQVLSAAIFSVTMALSLAWRLALLIIALQPFIIGSFYARGILMKSMSKKVLKAQTSSSKLASEAISNHKTIAAFCVEKKIMGLFQASLKGPKSESRKQSWYAGLGLFVSQFLTAANSGLIFWYGGRLLYHKQITYRHLFQTFLILVTTGRVIAEAGTMTSDLSKGREAIKSVFMVLKRKSKIETNEIQGIKPEKIIGEIELKEVDFTYPSRPEQKILVSLSLKIEAGTTVALVGQSGSGKSTIINLIERFYDPLKGLIMIDELDIKTYNLRFLRSNIALVSQEPILFAGTIHENIAYGKENATEAEIIEAATLAHAHDFISSMKDGYATYCGEKGAQLSGGQKQRIALARAIIKNPAILLLDEATSALDSKSESLVQDAMESLMISRTCVVVAHNLSTIQKADSIAVIDNGRLVEKGTHSELLAKGENGSYYSLVRLQQRYTLKVQIPQS